VPRLWDPIAGLYRCGDGGWVRLHTNFTHHRDGVLALLDLPAGAQTPREAVAEALCGWQALAFEQAASDAGLVVAALRSFEQWDAHPQAAVIAAQPLVAIERIGAAPPLRWPALTAGAPPLQGLRVLDLTRILAGPTGGRALAAYGADVMLINSPQLPNIESIAETSRGKLSAHVDLREASGVAALQRLVRDAHVFAQGYRPGGLHRLGFGAAALAQMRPGIVCVSLSAYGDDGPWGGRRGFDSLVQTATGFNDAEARAAGEEQPRAMPQQILDYASGFLMAFGAQAALRRQQLEGGSWQVRVSLARTALWLRSLGRIENGFAAPRADFAGLTETTPSGFGELVAVQHAARFSRTPAVPTRLSMPPGTHPPVWPGVRD
jgi:crotonobetainyl-CoA:carnitine CoA-transferase CaiB-like acyl-CoA transferase